MLPTTPVLRRLAPAVLLLAFARDVRAQVAPAGDALGKLVPEGTAVYVQAPSLDRLGNAVRKVIAAFDKEKAQSFDIDEMLEKGELPLSPKNIDHQKPLAFCLVLPATQGGQPSPVFLLPATDAEALKKDIAATGMPLMTSVSGSYVTVSMSPDTKPAAAAAIANGMPAGEIAARIDLKRLVAHFRPMIDMGLSQLQMAMAGASQQAPGGMDVGPILKMYSEGIRSVVDSGETLDLALRLDGNRAEIASNLTAQEKSALAEFGSKEKTDVKSLARFLDSGSPITMAFGMDSAAMAKRVKPMIDVACSAYPEPLRSDFKKMMAGYDELAAQMGSAACGSGSVSASGMRFAIYMHPKDPAKLVAAYKSMLKSTSSFKVSEPKDEMLDGQPVTRMRVQVDSKVLADALEKSAPAKTPGATTPTPDIKAMIESIYGKDGLQFTIAPRGDVTAVVVGGDDAFVKSSIAKIAAKGQPPAGVARGVEQVGDLNPCFVLQYDIGKMMHEMQGLMAEGMPAGVSFPNQSATLTSWIGVDGRTFKGAMSVDLSELGAFATAMKNAEDAKSPAPKK
jgi:hypothetical protein